jgi:hypothetical protein
MYFLRIRTAGHFLPQKSRGEMGGRADLYRYFRGQEKSLFCRIALKNTTK